MTPQEQEMIDGLISRIRTTPVQTKDTAAEQRLQKGLAGYPDSLYVLAQTVLVQQYGLSQAQSQMEDLKQQNAALQEQLQQAAQAPKASGGSFLSHIFGSGSDQSAPSSPANAQYAPVNSGGSYPPQNYPSQSYPPQNYPGGGYPPPPASYPAPSGGGMFGGGGGGGFLQGAMRTAAGVAAGEMAFRGIEDLFHGFGGGGGGERGFTGQGGGETVVNNYYDDDRGNTRDTGSFYNPSDDASRGGGGTQFTDTSDNDSNFTGSGDDSSGLDDTSSYDDGGTDDSSGNL